jgi:adenosylcobinamide-phosphate synthase
MSVLVFLQPLVPMLSAVLTAVLVDVSLRFLAPPARDRVDPLFGIPASVAGRLERTLNRVERTLKVRRTRGAIAFSAIIFLALVLGSVASVLGHHFEIIVPVIWFFCFRITFGWSAGSEILKAKNIDAARTVLARRRVPVSVPTKNPDKHAVLRMLTEAIALSLHEGLLTPVFWAAVAEFCGVSGIFAAVFVVTLLEASRAIVTTENTNAVFAAPFRFVELVLNFVPARIAAVLWVLAAVFTPKTSQKGAWGVMFNQSSKHRLYNEGWPVGAVAGALGIALPAGIGREAWIGSKNATAQVSPEDLKKALWLHGVVLGLVVLIFVVIIFLGLSS